MLQAINPKSPKHSQFHDLEKTINHKNSQKVPFGRQKGPLQITNDNVPPSLTLHAINGQSFFCQIT